MFAAAMLDIGASSEKLKRLPETLGIKDFTIEITKTDKHGLSATDFNVVLGSGIHSHGHAEPSEAGMHGHAHVRRLQDIAEIINNSGLSAAVRRLALKTFRIVAEAEGRVHGKSPEEVHFHEVGAADSIADILSAAICAEDLGFPQFICSPLSEGSGHVKCAHGVFPVPAPATAEILKSARIPFKITLTDGEMVTPTGAAIAAALCGSFGEMPDMAVERIGYGAGKKDFEHPNVLRAFLGETAEQLGNDTIEVLETCLDDTTGEELGSCMDALFREGAADAYYTPVFMKKNRPAYMLTVLCKKGSVQKCANIIFQYTGSVGMRIRTSRRLIMQREIREITTAYGAIPVKFSVYGTLKKFKPEHDAVIKAANKYGVAEKEVCREVEHEAAKSLNQHV